jgi:hypothetical protein
MLVTFRADAPQLKIGAQKNASYRLHRASCEEPTRQKPAGCQCKYGRSPPTAFEANRLRDPGGGQENRRYDCRSVHLRMARFKGGIDAQKSGSPQTRSE